MTKWGFHLEVEILKVFGLQKYLKSSSVPRQYKMQNPSNSFLQFVHFPNKISPDFCKSQLAQSKSEFFIYLTNMFV